MDRRFELPQRLQKGEQPQTEVRPINWERIIRYAQALDAVEHGGLYRGRFGRVFIHSRNPYTEVVDLKGVNTGQKG